jgi:uncharacterized protein YlxP (DUF503 family)
MVFSVISIEIQLPGCRSLKEKRHLIKPLLNRLIRNYKVTAAETGFNDVHDLAIINCGLISNNNRYAAARLSSIPGFIEENFSNLVLLKYSLQEFY